MSHRLLSVNFLLDFSGKAMIRFLCDWNRVVTFEFVECVHDCVEQKDLVDEMDRKVIGRYGVFGTTTRRFHRTSVERSPGPGSYQQQPQDQPRL